MTNPQEPDQPDGQPDSDDGVALATIGQRGPLRIHCRDCGEFKKANSLPILRSFQGGNRWFFYKLAPDIAWFRRRRLCNTCGTEFFTAEVDERLIEELLRHRQKQGRRRREAITKACADVRSNHKWLDSIGDDIPHELAFRLVAGSAWWLTHSSGPVRAPGHADHLEKLYCGWGVKFGANTFCAGRTLALARDYAKSLIMLTSINKLPTEADIRKHLREIPSRCVLNVNRDFYE